MLILSHEKKVIIAIGIFLAVVIAIGAGTIYPTIIRIRAVNHDALNLQVYLEKRYENARQMRSSMKQIKIIQEAVAHYNQYLFFAGDELRLITELENLANQNQLEQRIENSNFTMDSSRHLNIGLTITGSYQPLLQYLTDLESQDYFLNITQLHWTGLSPTASQPNRAQMRLQVSLYVNK
jgi:Tfp pilus assembly protein PilO